MATRKTTTTVEEQAPEDVELIEVDDVEEAAESALDGMLAEFSGADDVSVNVYRQGEGKNISFLFKTMPEDMNGGDIMERCRDQFGTGDYRLHVRKGPRILANRSFSVEAPKEVTPSTPKDSSGDIVALITAQMANQQQMFLGAMQAMAEAFKGGAQNQPAVDPIAMQTSMLQGLVTMKELSDSGKSNEPGAVEMLIQGLNLAKELAPKTGETNVADLGLKLVEALPMLSQAGQRQPTAPVMRPGPPPGMVPGPDPKHPMVPGPDPKKATAPQPSTQPEPSKTETPESEAFLVQVRGSLQSLCRLAAEDKDPGIYAPMIVDQMGEEAVKEFIGQKDALERMAAIEPMVKLYPGWFNHLKAAILEVIEDNVHGAGPEDAPEETPLPAEPEGELALNEPETLTPNIVLARINESGLRREGQQDAPVTIPSSDPDTPSVVWHGGDSNPTSDTERS